MTKYNVHIFREMRLYYPGIEAENHEEAAELASKMDTGEAEDILDCDGANLGATVDLAGDEFHINSQMIDFEPQRILGAAPKLLNALAEIGQAIEGGDPQAIADKWLSLGVPALAAATGKGAA